MEKARESAVVNKNLIFISWSGQASKHVALALRKHLKSFIPDCDPWMSDKDIEKGSRGIAEIEAKLKDAIFGIVVVTRENMNTPWINYEAGAIAKGLGATKVVPFLCNLGISELQGPLSNFQAIEIATVTLKALIKSIHSSTDSVVAEEQLESYFEAFYPKLIEDIEDAISKPYSIKTAKSPEQEALDKLARQIQFLRAKLMEPQTFIPEEYLETIFAKVSAPDTLAASLADKVKNLKSELKDAEDKNLELEGGIDQARYDLSNARSELNDIVEELDSESENLTKQISDELKGLKSVLSDLDSLESELTWLT